MDSATLANRLRGILNPLGGGSDAGRTALTPDAAIGGDGAHADPQRALGGQWHQHAGGACLVVERRTDAQTMCGRAPVGELAAGLEGAAAEATLLAGGAARPPFVFFDLETTGLSGGAGTYAFLVGCGWFDEDRHFITRQYVLTRFADERPLLTMVAGEFARAGAMVSFNGKSFDAPVLETRYLFHRLEWVGSGVPHLDVLHPARRFWGSARGDSLESCSLVSLERQVLGARRVGDVPGVEIPARYFQFVRSGDARPLVAVLEHNRLDLLSLAGLTARLVHLVRSGPDEVLDPREALALGHVYARAGFADRARDAFSRAASAPFAQRDAIAGTSGSMRSAASIASSGSMPLVRVAALRALAQALRRGRQYDEAADCWRRLLDARGCPRHVAREATSALAIYHEHRARDLAAAKAFALQSLGHDVPPAWNQAVRHRLARIERKMASERRPGLLS